MLNHRGVPAATEAVSQSVGLRPSTTFVQYTRLPVSPSPISVYLSQVNIIRNFRRRSDISRRRPDDATFRPSIVKYDLITAEDHLELEGEGSREVGVNEGRCSKHDVRSLSSKDVLVYFRRFYRARGLRFIRAELNGRADEQMEGSGTDEWTGRQTDRQTCIGKYGRHIDGQ